MPLWLPPMKNGAGGVLHLGLSVCECVHWVCASRKPCDHHIWKTNKRNFA